LCIRKGYGNLCRLLTLGKRRASKGQCELTIEDVVEWGAECVFVVLEGEDHAPTLKAAFSEDVFLSLRPLYDGEGEARFSAREEIAREMDIQRA